MDDHTWKDLGIFQARGDGRTLHDVLRRTKTQGGAKILRERMLRPLSASHRIRAVQDSLRYIMEHRAVFDCLPSEIVAHGVTEYINGGLPVVTSAKRVGFLVEAMTIRLEWRFYMLIMQGVLRTIKMIRGLQRLLDPVALPSPVAGELGPLLEEMRALLARRAFQNLPTIQSWDLPTRTLFSVDRGFRSHEEEALRRIVRLAYQLDALVAMADACVANDMVVPALVEGPTVVEADGLINLFVSNPVPVDVWLGRPRHMLFLTGPNMAGKSTLLRSLGAALYLAHLGMGVPAKRFRFAPCQSLVTALDVSDDIHAGVSFFRAEALRMKAIGEAMKSGRSVIALVDEPFKGTNVQDAMDASWLVLRAFSRANNSLFAISSHLIELGDTLLATDRVVCRHFAAADGADGLTFDFRIREGVSTQRLGMRVLEQEGLMTLLGAVP
jgi:DNA mismatch repair ATPase MutS